ncbi:MAG: REP-associated tyrosine transposase [Anaerolineae bacterium]
MMGIRRYYVPNAIVFITQVVHERTPIFAHAPHVELLRETLHRVKELHPFSMLGYVFLPEHFHLLIRPTGDSNFSQIMHSLKRNFARSYAEAGTHLLGPKVWQRRFWDHVIRNETDLQRHLDYIHYNPVKHGLVCDPAEWEHSSFGAWQGRGAYSESWGRVEPPSIGACVDIGE